MSEMGVRVHQSTISHSLHKAGLHEQVARKKPFLKKTHLKYCMEFVKKYLNDAAEMCSSLPLPFLASMMLLIHRCQVGGLSIIFIWSCSSCRLLLLPSPIGYHVCFNKTHGVMVRASSSFLGGRQFEPPTEPV